MAKSKEHKVLYVHLFCDTAGKPRFNVKGANRKIILTSESYGTPRDRDLAAEKIAKAFGCEIVITEPKIVNGKEKLFSWSSMEERSPSRRAREIGWA